jgi:hypothetical protein
VIGVLTAGTDVSLDGQELIAEVLYGAKTSESKFLPL